jgi:CheY-like chemotaxis protein
MLVLLAPVTILVAEDNATMRQMLASLCREWPDEVVECSNGQEAVRSLAEHQPAWVLMDIAMPGFDGLAATARIKAEFARARILILTQYATETLRQAAQQAGAEASLSKENRADVSRWIAASRGPSGLGAFGSATEAKERT